MKRFLKSYGLLVIILITLLSSCSAYKEIEVRDIQLDKFKLVSASKVNFNLDVDIYNPMRGAFTLTDIQGTVFRDGAPFAELSLLEEALVPAFQNGPIQVKCRVELLDPMAVLVMGLNVKSWNMKDFELKLKVTARKGMVKKTFKLNNVPVEKLVKKIKL